jgi:hypothetical protein
MTKALEIKKGSQLVFTPFSLVGGKVYISIYGLLLGRMKNDVVYD